jgi:rare lipoprotein A
MHPRRSLILPASLFLCAHVSVAHSPTHEGESQVTSPEATSAAAVAPSARKRVQQGKVSWYGPRFAGHKTASGERFDPQALTMAHRYLPLGTIVDVTNNANGKRVRVRVNDRGPYCEGRVADLSRAASERLGFVEKGVTDATIRVVSLPQDGRAG